MTQNNADTTDAEQFANLLGAAVQKTPVETRPQVIEGVIFHQAAQRPVETREIGVFETDLVYTFPDRESMGALDVEYIAQKLEEATPQVKISTFFDNSEDECKYTVIVRVTPEDR